MDVPQPFPSQFKDKGNPKAVGPSTWPPKSKRPTAAIPGRSPVSRVLLFARCRRNGGVEPQEFCGRHACRAVQTIDAGEEGRNQILSRKIAGSNVIDAKERQDVATCDVPNTFIQTEVEERDSDGNRPIVKITGACVDILCEIASAS